MALAGARLPKENWPEIMDQVRVVRWQLTTIVGGGVRSPINTGFSKGRSNFARASPPFDFRRLLATCSTIQSTTTPTPS
jgi:hypothetical protein